MVDLQSESSNTFVGYMKRHRSVCCNKPGQTGQKIPPKSPSLHELYWKMGINASSKPACTACMQFDVIRCIESIGHAFGPFTLTALHTTVWTHAFTVFTVWTIPSWLDDCLILSLITVNNSVKKVLRCSKQINSQCSDNTSCHVSLLGTWTMKYRSFLPKMTNWLQARPGRVCHCQISTITTTPCGTMNWRRRRNQSSPLKIKQKGSQPGTMTKTWVNGGKRSDVNEVKQWRERNKRTNARTHARTQLRAGPGLRATYHLRQSRPGWMVMLGRRRHGCRPPPISYTPSTSAGPPAWPTACLAPRFSLWHHSRSYPAHFSCKRSYSRPGPHFVCGLRVVSRKPWFCADLLACHSHLEAELLGLRGQGERGRWWEEDRRKMKEHKWKMNQEIKDNKKEKQKQM